MYELKKETMKVIDNINQDWVAAIQDAEKSGSGLKLDDIFAKFSKHVQILDQKFQEAELRLQKKKGWLG